MSKMTYDLSSGTLNPSVLCYTIITSPAGGEADSRLIASTGAEALSVQT